MNRRNTYRTSLGILIVGILVIAGVVAYLFRSPAGIPAAEGSSSIASEASSVHTDPENGPGAAEKEAEASAAEGSAEEGPSEDEASKNESSRGESSKDGSEEEQSDDWKMMLVNRWNPIPDDYTFETFELRNGQAVDKRIYEDLQAMFDAAREDGIYPYIVESYRTHEDQIAMMDYYVGVYESEGLSEEEAREKAETVVAIADDLVFHQVQHLHLRDRREQQPELHLVIPVLRVKPRLELVVAHQGEVRIVVEVARVGLQLVETPLLAERIPESAPLPDKTGWLARKGKIRRGVISIDEELVVAVDR